MVNATTATLEAGITSIMEAPKTAGRVELISRRPAEGEREVIEVGTLDTELGLVGDYWSTPAGGAFRTMQLTLVNARAAAVVIGPRERWHLSGDQLYVDLDLSGENLPPGTRLAIGTAVVEVSDQPHTGCSQYRDRFGSDAVRFVNSEQGRALNLRGLNTTIVVSGEVRVGDEVRKLD
jgi:hypothetical protein